MIPQFRERSARNRRRLISQGLLGQQSAYLPEIEPLVEPEEPPVLEPRIGPVEPEERFRPTRPTAGLAAVRHLLSLSEPLTWVFTGDNLAQGGRYTEGCRSLCEHFGERIRCEMARHLDVVINTGVSGDNVRRLLRNFDWRVLRFRPNVVAVSVGMNDAKEGRKGRDAFRRQLREILDRIRTADAIPLLQTPNAICPSAVSNRADLPAYVDILRDEAARVDLPLIDHWEHWHRLTDETTRQQWLGDGRIQPGPEGHRELARLLFHELGIFDPASPTCRIAPSA